MSAATQPETLREAQTWETVKRHAAEYGLCHACAAQLAYGHQLGFSATTRQPCAECVWTVATLPNAKPNGWRTVEGTASRRASWDAAINAALLSTSDLARIGGPGNAQVASETASERVLAGAAA